MERKVYWRIWLWYQPLWFLHIYIYIYIWRNLQIIKNSQTKCVKDEWFKSSFVFDTISLKKISPLTQSLWCFETHGRLPPRIKWSIAWKWSTQDCALQTTLCLFLSLWHKMKCTKIFSLLEFFWKVVFMNERLWKIIRCWTDTLF